MAIIEKTPINTQGKARVDLIKSDFDALIWQKGYEVVRERAIKCPCRNTVDSQALSSCRNCGGSGWVWINPTITRMVIQSTNKDTKFKEWSAEKVGTIRITSLNDENLSYMDRITVTNAYQTISQILHFKQHKDGVWRTMATYDIKKMMNSFIFKNDRSKLLQSEEGLHFNIVKGKWIELNQSTIDMISSDQNWSKNPTISIQYRHNPAYYVLDVNRDMMTSKELKGTDMNRDLPLSAVGRSAHYVLDEDNFSGDLLHDNSNNSNQCSSD